MKIGRIASVALVAQALAAAAPAAAEELRIAMGQAGNNGLVQGMHRFGDVVARETGGAYTSKVYAGSLLNYAETMTGLRDGIADVGFVVPAYHRAEFPNTNFIGDMSTLTTDPVVMGGIVNEYMMLECARCLKEYNDQGQVFLGMAISGPYYLMSTNRVSSLKDFSGRKYRGFGPFGRWIAAMGGTPVVLSANDIYESISQGQIDGNTHIVDVLKSLSLGEVTDYLLDVPIGLFPGNSMFNTSKMLWDDLGDDEKRAFIRAGGDATAWTTVTYLAENRAFLNDPASVGVELVEPDADLAAASEKFRADDIATVAVENAEKYGIGDTEEQIARMKALAEKWEKLVETIDKTDPQAVIDLYYREIFSKVDPASLG